MVVQYPAFAIGVLSDLGAFHRLFFFQAEDCIRDLGRSRGLGDVYKRQIYNNDWSWRHIPTLSLYHPAYIARMEYKLLTVRKEAHKLDLFVERFIG